MATALSRHLHLEARTVLRRLPRRIGRRLRRIGVASAAPVIACLMAAAPAHPQADTPVGFVTFENQGEAWAAFRSRCGGADYLLQRGEAGWSLERNGVQISQEIDAVLSEQLNSYNLGVSLIEMTCVVSEGSREEALRFNVARDLHHHERTWLLLGVYEVRLENDQLVGHELRILPGSDATLWRIITDVELFLRARGETDVPGLGVLIGAAPIPPR